MWLLPCCLGKGPSDGLTDQEPEGSFCLPALCSPGRGEGKALLSRAWVEPLPKPTDTWWV